MIMGATTQLTIEEFLRLPDEPGKQELLDGELIALPPAKLSHMQIVLDLYRLLVAALTESRVWAETGYQLSRGWLQPDTVFRKESWERVTESYACPLLDFVVDLRVLVPSVA